MAQIILKKMQFYAYHGFFDDEQKIGANYELTLSLDLDTSQPSMTDELKHTLNYQEIYDVVKLEMSIPSRLIENVAQRIIDALYNKFEQVKEITLKFSKLNPPLGGQVDRVTICLKRSRI